MLLNGAYLAPLLQMHSDIEVNCTPCGGGEEYLHLSPCESLRDDEKGCLPEVEARDLVSSVI